MMLGYKKLQKIKQQENTRLRKLKRDKRLIEVKIIVLIALIAMFLYRVARVVLG